MSNSYFEQSPISDIHISELKIPLSGLIVLVGANSSGKTNLLREIHAAISGTERALIVAKKIRFRPVPGFNDYLVHLQQTGDIESVPQPGGAPHYRKIGHQYGTQTGTGGQWQEHELGRKKRGQATLWSRVFCLCEFLAAFLAVSSTDGRQDGFTKRKMVSGTICAPLALISSRRVG